MKTNVSTLLRDFPKVRKAAFAGEEVIIVTRDGNLRLTAEPPSGESILGSLKGEITFAADDLDQPTNIKVPLLTRDKALKRSKAVETVW